MEGLNLTSMRKRHAGEGGLTLIDPLGLRASGEVTIRPRAQAGARLEIKAASGAVPSPLPPGSEDDDIDGCDVQVEVPTSDEDLPEAEGGVA